MFIDDKPNLTIRRKFTANRSNFILKTAADIRSCLKTQGHARERRESDEEKSILMRVLFFVNFVSFAGEKLVLKQLFRNLTAKRCAKQPNFLVLPRIVSRFPIF